MSKPYTRNLVIIIFRIFIVLIIINVVQINNRAPTYRINNVTSTVMMNKSKL